MKKIQCIITYKYLGSRGICGQTVGADGKGDYAEVFISNTYEEIAEKTLERIKELQRTSRIVDLKCIYDIEGYYGSPIKIVEV